MNLNQNKSLNNNMFMPDLSCENSARTSNNSTPSSNLRKMTSVQNLNEDGDEAEKFPEERNLDDYEEPDLDEENDSVQEIDEIMFGFVNSGDDYQLSLSSPSSLNSDDCVYAYRGRIEIMPNNNNENHMNYHQNGAGIMQNDIQQNEQDNEETDDFLEMDFDPETNSEIENDPQSDNVSSHQHLVTNGNHKNEENNQEMYNGTSSSSSNCVSVTNWGASNHQASCVNGQHIDNQKTVQKNTGTKPKIPSYASTSASTSKSSRTRHSEEKLHINNNYYSNSSSYGNSSCLDSHSSLSYNNSNHHNNFNNNNNNNISNLDYLSNGSNNNLLLNDNQFYNLSMENQLNNNHFKYHQNYSYLEKNHHHFHNDHLLLDIEPYKARNSVTIYTTNCDEKILVDALTSLNLEPNRELISSYFNNIIAQSSTSESNLINYIINKSKLNCNYKGLIDLIERSCRNIDDDNYGLKKFDINFYTLDLFSNQPELIEIHVNEVVKRWTPNTNLRQLADVKNKYFHQTNVLGKIVNIIRKTMQEPTFKFKDSDTIKIPQFYKSGYITITLLK